MSKHQRAAAAASGFLLLVSAGAAAAQAGRVSPAAPPSAASEALVRRYLAAVHYKDTVLAMVKAQSPDLIHGMGAGFPAATREEARRVDEIVNAFVRDQMLPALAAKMVPVAYFRAFTASNVSLTWSLGFRFE
jgi:hypothetical protein